MAFPQTFFRWRPHPWHGLEVGQDPPRLVNAYIEITPYDRVKYEIDKKTGYLLVDRPQRTSSQPPALYGFIPRTFCGARVGALTPKASLGDGDPLDICVISERPIDKSEVLLRACVVGGLRCLDHNEADDKIVAVLDNDNVWGDLHDISELPPAIVERLRHYFATYKLVPGQQTALTVEETYGHEEAFAVIRAAVADYELEYGG
ncbi:MAG TPA: inorganic pyrophosphatase [Candidatus Krumholzibacteria bacterium]|nr:inorganic pyrophosphatase [Candidatus Krumholzibacteria bacterium]HPD70600.1 inorganic pyrophosphatase [Candidatus Krumholzibacteria bacterium]HRY39700.1 inorganic pyrophosphatase [Candidatus Krumholzibacteria bacterium]